MSCPEIALHQKCKAISGQDNGLELEYRELLSMEDAELHDLFTEEDQTEKERYD